MSTISKVMSSSESDAGMSQRMVWVDLEMTGLDIERDQIIEMACIITDSDLNILAEGPNLIINQSSELLDRMSDWCKEHHGQSGLTQAVRDSKVSLLQAEYEFLSFIRQHTPPGHCPLAGNSVHADKKFLDKYMPQFMHHLHYRIIDVSTIKELCSCLHNIQVVEFVPKDLYGGFLKNTCLHHRRKHLTEHWMTLKKVLRSCSSTEQIFSKHKWKKNSPRLWRMRTITRLHKVSHSGVGKGILGVNLTCTSCC
ncbi:small fragment nuclease isoform X6 [Hypomesus transpacificus]|uniref:small fragment nuclease isoform X6 n=1 Tax=Hypomesus transpacificus TaxID=137520 RepID=UPI001F079938|nr:small fragment nuclease isoform X6 [Hypomesus transpacificus]